MVELLDPRSVPLWTAFFAGVVSVVGLIIAKEHRVSDFRQAWIDALRGEIASLIARVNAINEWCLAIKTGRAKAAADGGPQGSLQSEDDVAEQYKMVHPDVLKMEEALAMIELRLNPNEKEAEPLLQKAEAVVCRVRLDKAVCRKELKRLEKKLLDESKHYLKKEWERVKRGECRYKVAVGVSFTIAMVGVVALVLGLVGLVRDKAQTGAIATPAALQVEATSAAGNVTEPEVPRWVLPATRARAEDEPSLAHGERVREDGAMFGGVLNAVGDFRTETRSP